MQDRGYQMKMVNESVEKVSTKIKVCVQAPTGSGKTVMFSMLTDRYIKNTDKSVLIIVHRIELLNQAKRKIFEITGIDPVLITSSSKKKYESRIYVGMVESISKRMHLLSNLGLVIIDECHIANFNKVHNDFLDLLIIGFTATPISSSKKNPLNKYYNDIVIDPQVDYLIEQCFLSQNITRLPKLEIDESQLKVDTLKGDYKEGQMAIEYSQPKNIVNTARCYRKYCLGRKTIVFNVNIEHSKAVNEAFLMYGYNSRHLDSNSEDREDIMEWFKQTPDAILQSVMIPTVGFDEPTVENVILNFSTLSLVKFLQCCGRGGRLIDEQILKYLQPSYNYILTEKSTFNIVDMGGNGRKFGDWNWDRDWKRLFDNPPKPGDGIAPVKSCPKCYGLVHASLMVCPLKDENGDLCGYEFEKKRTHEEIVSDEMEVITKNIDIEKLVSQTQHKYDYFLFVNLVKPVIDSVFEKFEEPNEFILNKAFTTYYDLCIEWWKGKMAGVNGNINDITDSAFHIRRAKINFDNYVNIAKKQKEKSITHNLTA